MLLCLSFLSLLYLFLFYIFVTLLTFENTVCCGTPDINLAANTTRSLHSYNFPHSYPNKMDCTWLISALFDGFVEVHFLDFDTEIRFDFFSLGFGHSITEKSRVLYLDGQWAPISVTSNDPYLWIRFETDVSKSGRGFDLTLSTLITQGKCNS